MKNKILSLALASVMLPAAFPVLNVSAAEGITDITPTDLFEINFDDDAPGSGLYTFHHEYSSVSQKSLADQGISTTMVYDTGAGLTDAADDISGKASDSNYITALTTGKSSASAISGNAMYSYVPSLNDNFYKGSFLSLDSSYIQKTDRISVSYDFALYNLIVSNNSKPAMPQSITMTSEATEAGAVPTKYTGNTMVYPETDAKPSNTQIGRHLLTFYTGTSANLADFKNKLAYYDPAAGAYADLTTAAGSDITLDENVYNYFHVDSEIDFLNSTLTFKLTKVSDSAAEESNEITISIPKYASWNGIIMASERASGSVDTNHYMYLDNVAVKKTGLDLTYVDTEKSEYGQSGQAAITVPAARVPEDNFIVNNPNALTADAWAYDKIAVPENIETSDGYYTEGSYTDFYGVSPSEPVNTRVAQFSDQTGNQYVQKEYAATYLYQNEIFKYRGITTYTEFDFYLPKQGSYMTVLTKNDGNSSYGNMITITNAGISSYNGLFLYDSVKDTEDNIVELDCGKWYSLQLIHDQRWRYMTINLYEYTNGVKSQSPVGTAYVYARNLGAGGSKYYDRVEINRKTIFTNNDGVSLKLGPATTYLANFCFYQKATRVEFYPEHTYAENEDARIKKVVDGAEDLSTDYNTVNNTRLDSGMIIDFEQDTVESARSGGSASDKVSIGSIPDAPEVANATFTGWKLISTNGEGESTEIIKNADTDALKAAAGSGADRIKFVAEYSGYRQFTHTEKYSGSWNNDLIKWSVTSKDWYQPDSSLADHMSGVWSIDTSLFPTVTDGYAEVVFSYGIYNMPTDFEASASAEVGNSSEHADWAVPSETDPALNN